MHDFLVAVLAILTALTAIAAIAVLTILAIVARISSCCVDKVKCMVGADFEDQIARTIFLICHNRNGALCARPSRVQSEWMKHQ